jgi:uncharacterized OB-fold protein
MPYSKPLPIPNSEFLNYWKGCQACQLKFRRCKNCGTVNWPESYVCQHCTSVKFVGILSEGVGKIYTFVVYQKAFHPSFKDDLPYVTAVVELDEGPKILTNIVNCPWSEVFCGMDVVVQWCKVSEECWLPKFRPCL